MGTSTKESEAGPYSVLAVDALMSEPGSYIADFSAFASSATVRCLQISQSVFSFVTRNHKPHNAKKIREYFQKRRIRKDMSRMILASENHPCFLQETKDPGTGSKARIFTSLSAIQGPKDRAAVMARPKSSLSMITRPVGREYVAKGIKEDTAYN